MLSRYLTLALLSFVIATVAAEARALDPVFIPLSPPCASGSARAYRWMLYEDQNGDGLYDFVTLGDCDGSVIGRPLLVGSDPLDPTPYDIHVGDLPAGTFSATTTLSTTLHSNGLFTWTLYQRDSNGEVICTVSRTPDMEYETTCPGGVRPGME